MINLFNTLSRKKEEFKPIEPGKAGVYSCGPTVYWFAHIGNMRAFLFADLLCRTLRFNGLTVEQVMNITDVGHLTGDVDDGEDKMLVAMQREGKSALEIAEFYSQAFFSDLDKLNIVRADHYPRATEHIAEQIAMIEQLEKNGFTYRTSDGIYFDTSKLSDYGRLSGQRSDEKQAGVRVDMGEKKNATDFALWKFSPTSTKREMEWESPWGVGFPGWHIECSAMSKKYLGIPFDIHTGGIDHIAVHHENELAQTEGAEGKLEANVWMHNEFITVDSGKMSKSLGNIYTISDLIEKGFDPLAFRYLCLQAHYRSKLNFTFEALEAASNALNRLRSIIRDWEAPAVGCMEFEQKFLNALNDDLNTSEALSVMWQLVESDFPTSAKAESLLKFDRVFGLGLEFFVGKPIVSKKVISLGMTYVIKKPDEEDVVKEHEDLILARAKARAEMNWQESDRLRIELENLGIVVDDKPEGQSVYKK